MDLLSPESAENWRRGRVPYLERVVRCNLSKASRILRILRMHARDFGPQTLAHCLQTMDQGLSSSLTVFKDRGPQYGSGLRPSLCFST
jgi:hypothetical protein